MELPIIEDEHLVDWELIGSGGFGLVFKAKDKKRQRNVAIKQLSTTQSTLYKEAAHMVEMSSPYVVTVFGIYQGIHHGIVMEFMCRGSIQTLQRDYPQPLPSPLSFRLAHQVALGMHRLHSDKSKKLVHSDLKPSNILLDESLNAKLADFGLSRITCSVSNNTETNKNNGGTYKYMPPEAFSANYNPARSFDIYSYGVLLWSILSGKEPYPGKDYDLVAYSIKRGDRPDEKEIMVQVDGIEKLIDLMTKCWKGSPSARPKSQDVVNITGNLFSEHKTKIDAVIDEVLLELNKVEISKPFQPVMAVNPEHPDSVDHPGDTLHHISHNVKKDLTVAEKAIFVEQMRSKLIQRTTNVMPILDDLFTAKMIHEEALSRIKVEPTLQRRTRELFDGPLRSGRSVKAAFFDALLKHEPALIEDLWRSSSCQ